MRFGQSVWLSLTLAVLLAIGLSQAVLSGQHGPVTKVGMAAAVIGLVLVGRDLFRELKRSKT